MSFTNFACGDALDIANAHLLHERLQEVLNASSSIRLEAGEVSKADTAGLQILVAAIQEVERNEGEIVWVNPSESLMQTAHNLGLVTQLQLPN